MRVREAYRQLRGSGQWVSLTELRRALPDIPRDVLDATIRAQHLARDTSVVPESNQKMLTQDDQDAAIPIGGRLKHLIAIDLDRPHQRDNYVAARVRDAHYRLTSHNPGDSVTIADLRHALSDIHPTELDHTLHRMTHPDDPAPPRDALPDTGRLHLGGEFGDTPKLLPPEPRNT